MLEPEAALDRTEVGMGGGEGVGEGEGEGKGEGSTPCSFAVIAIMTSSCCSSIRCS